MSRRNNRRQCLLGLAVAVLAVASVVAAVSVCSGSDSGADLAPQIAPSRPDVALEPEPGRGFIPPPFDLPPVDAPLPRGMLPLVARFDWRESGKVTSVKNQGACGSCYAFAAAGNIESRLLIDGVGTVDISENNLKECEYFGSSCGGGNYWRMANLLSIKGTVLESCDPYLASDVACKTTCPYQTTLLDWREFSHDTVPSVATIKAYLQAYGPIYTSMNAGHGDAWGAEFNSYNGSYTLYTTVSGTSTHAVLIVGWDDDAAHTGGQGAWIVKNSWGTSWGGTCGYGTQRGYFTIAYGSANIGSWASFIAAWQDYDTDGSVLYNDEAGYVNSLGYGVTMAWGMAKLIPAEDVVPKRVEFWTTDATPDVDVFVYETFSGGAVSGLIASKLNTAFDLPGYHSIELPSIPRISSGNDVYVVMKITNAAYKYPLVYDSAGPRAAGSSYISYNGTSWSEWTGGDLGIRLRVTTDGACGQIMEHPVATVRDVPGDGGGHVRLTWTRSTYDAESASPQVRRYRVWRESASQPQALVGSAAEDAEGAIPAIAGGPYPQGENGPSWELAGTMRATGQCTYSLDVHTPCDSGPGDPCWTKFYVTAHTGTFGQRFASPVDSGYSVDNLFGRGVGPGRTPIPHDTDQDGIKVTRLGAPEPNPASGDFLIRYDIAAPGWLRLEVYDISGRRVSTLADGHAARGHHSAAWDGRGLDGARLAPGMYFVRLITRTEAQTAKMVLLR